VGQGGLVVTEPSHAILLSYASQDAEAAQRICEALRDAGTEVWLDQSELRGGDAWDESIRDQIKACALFIPVISANAHARVEGYFRLEWKLAVDRSHRMAPKQPFLLPMVIDDTPQSDDAIPDRFRELQWTRLPGGHATPAFVERVRRLLLPESDVPTATPPQASATSGAPPAIRESVRASWWSKPAPLAIVAVFALALAYFVADRFWVSKYLAARVRAAYNYAEHLPQRPRMMQAWADHLNELREDARSSAEKEAGSLLCQLSRIHAGRLKRRSKSAT
jgi:hypothetical protein